MKAFPTAVIVFSGVVAGLPYVQGDTSHDSHTHESLFEQASVYDMEAGTSSLILLPGGDESTFEEDSFAFMVVPAESADEDGLEGAEEEAEAAWEAYSEGEEDPVELPVGEAAEPSSTTVYEVTLEDPLRLVQVNVTDPGAYAFFFEHGSDEVSVGVYSPSGVEYSAGAEEGTDDADDDDEESSSVTGTQWANAMIASVAVSLCSFAGLLIVASGRIANGIDLSHACIFACGALLAAAILHIIPEALEGLESRYPDSIHDMGIAAGIVLLAGIFFGVILHSVLEAGHSHAPSHQEHSSRVAGDEGGCTPGDAARKSDSGVQNLLAAPKDGIVLGTDGRDARASSALPPTTARDTQSASKDRNLRALMEARKDKALIDVKGLQPVCWNVILGDLVHNFADGVTIGAAFLGCSSTIGWTVTASAIVHEVPHELADFMALINGGMSKLQAFFYNFISALSAVLGTLIVMALGEELGTDDISFILLFGAGSFIFIGLTELLPQAMEASEKAAQTHSLLCSQLLKLLTFVVGAVAIGIPLLWDQHCESGDDTHSH